MRQEIDDRAARWCALRLSGDMTEELRRDFADWLAESPDHDAAMRRYEAALLIADEAGKASLAEEFERELNDEHARRRRRGLMPAIAASLAALLAIGFAVFFQRPDPALPLLYASAIGEQRSISLDDGSRAHLNTNSTLAVEYARDRRLVRLRQGEALFDVAPDESRPFLVETSLASIRVTGTAFNVQAFPEETTVLVVSGTVEVTPANAAPAAVTGGWQIRIDSRGEVVISAADHERALAWRHGKARYADTPLGEVIADLNRYFEKPAALADAALADIPVTGEFDTSDQKLVIKSLTVAFGLHSREEDERILLSPAD